MPDATSPDFRFFYITSTSALRVIGRPVCMGSWLAVILQPTFTVKMPSSSDTTDTIAAFTPMPLAATHVGVSLRLLQCLSERLGAVAFCIRTSSVSRSVLCFWDLHGQDFRVKLLQWPCRVSRVTWTDPQMWRRLLVCCSLLFRMSSKSLQQQPEASGGGAACFRVSLSLQCHAGSARTVQPWGGGDATRCWHHGGRPHVLL